MLQPAAQLAITSPHTVTESPQGIVVQSGSVHGTQAPALLQLEPFAQLPHETFFPQPSLTDPQVRVPQGLVFGTQHWFLSHSYEPGQLLGHVIVPPQPSGTFPHATLAQACDWLSGVQHALS